MAISFSTIPSNLRIPSVSAEFDATKASQGPALMPYRALLVGQKLAAGTATANTVVRVTSAAQVQTLAGEGSMLHRQAIAWFASNTSTELWIGVLADDGTGVAAAGAIAVTGPATAAGTIALYIGGVRITVSVADDAAATAIATSIGAAITAHPECGFTATVLDDDVTVTYVHKGEVGNWIRFSHSYADGEALPAGVGLTFTQPVGGTKSPALATLIAALGDIQYHVIAHPYTDATSLSAIEVELASRFDGQRMIDGVAITSASGSEATLAALGNGRNSPHSAIVAQPGEKPVTPPAEFAAEVAALVARYGNADPARPFQTLAMSHALPVLEADLFTDEERNLLLWDGIATTKANGSVVQLDRMITTYQTNAAGGADTAYLDVTTLLTLMYLRYSFRARMLARYPRHKLAADGTRVGAGQAVITPLLGKAEALCWFREMEELGLVEDFDSFKKDLVVERNSTDANRLDFLLPPNLVNGLIVTAVSIQFRV